MICFWIIFDEGVEFVVKNFLCMQGGEIFVLKILLICIIDLVEVMSGSSDYELVGICLGEKLYEVMVLEEMVYYIIEFDDYYVIVLVIMFFDKNVDYWKNCLNEIGMFVVDKFEYYFGINFYFLIIEELQELDW